MNPPNLPQLPHFRGVDDWRSIGILLDTNSNEAAQMFDAILYQTYTFYHSPVLQGIEGAFKRMFAADPDFSMSQIFHLQSKMKVLSSKSVHNPETSKIIASLQNKLPAVNSWLKLHIQAAIHQAQGFETRAYNNWVDALALCPNDLFAGNGCLYYGLLHSRPDVIVSSFSQINNTRAYVATAYYAPVKSRLAFGLNESGVSGLATSLLGDCLNACPWDAWTHHAIAHVYDSLGESSLGLNHLRQHEANWDLGNDASLLGCHNYWHEALFACDLGETDVALEILDQQIMRRALHTKKPNYFEMSDVVALLMRLEFEQLIPSAELQKRWQEINEWVCRDEVDDSCGLFFCDIHIAMCLLAARQPEKFHHFLDSFHSNLKHIMKHNGELDLYHTMNSFGWTFLASIEAFFAEQYATCVDLLYPIRHKIVQGGGSKAQRHGFWLMLFHALARSSSDLNLRRLRILLDEYKSTRRECPTADRIINKYLVQHQAE